jgi:hypothetical protein
VGKKHYSNKQLFPTPLPASLTCLHYIVLLPLCGLSCLNCLLLSQLINNSIILVYPEPNLRSFLGMLLVILLYHAIEVAVFEQLLNCPILIRLLQIWLCAVKPWTLAQEGKLQWWLPQLKHNYPSNNQTEKLPSYYSICVLQQQQQLGTRRVCRLPAVREERPDLCCNSNNSHGGAERWKGK